MIEYNFVIKVIYYINIFICTIIGLQREVSGRRSRSAGPDRRSVPRGRWVEPPAPAMARAEVLRGTGSGAIDGVDHARFIGSRRGGFAGAAGGRSVRGGAGPFDEPAPAGGRATHVGQTTAERPIFVACPRWGMTAARVSVRWHRRGAGPLVDLSTRRARWPFRLGAGMLAVEAVGREPVSEFAASRECAGKSGQFRWGNPSTTIGTPYSSTGYG